MIYNNTHKSSLIAGYLFHTAFNTWSLVLLTIAIPGELLPAFDTTQFMIVSLVVTMAGVVVLVATKGKLGFNDDLEYISPPPL